MISVNGVLKVFTNPDFKRPVADDGESKEKTSLKRAQGAFDEISQWLGYQSTPLYALDKLAQDIHVAKIWYKDESQRFHLKSFKALGGAYAVAIQLLNKIEQQTGTRPVVQDLLKNKFSGTVGNIVISCATDGNHGRSVAWGCQMFGCQCVIYIHRDVSDARKQSMQDLGASVIRISGNYDDSVKQADRDAHQHNRIIVSDTSYAGYMDIPADVALGYTVLLTESIEQLAGDIPTHVFIQAGVGGLASAVCAYFQEVWGASSPRFIVVEPENANCLQQSARQGEPVVVGGDLNTLMAGLACGEVSALAWDILKTGTNDFTTINEAAVPLTMKLLARGYQGDPAIEAGESAVAGLAALITARHSKALSRQLNLDSDSRIYILGTEGATDPELYQQLLTA